jgi:hypothetical protein
MSKPIITFSLSDDGNSIFVYEGDITKDEQTLRACVGLQREDCGVMLQDLLHEAIGSALMVELMRD